MLIICGNVVMCNYSIINTHPSSHLVFRFRFHFRSRSRFVFVLKLFFCFFLKKKLTRKQKSPPSTPPKERPHQHFDWWQVLIRMKRNTTRCWGTFVVFSLFFGFSADRVSLRWRFVKVSYFFFIFFFKFFFMCVYFWFWIEDRKGNLWEEGGKKGFPVWGGVEGAGVFFKIYIYIDIIPCRFCPVASAPHPHKLGYSWAWISI